MPDLVEESRAAAAAGVPFGGEHEVVDDELVPLLEEVEQDGVAVTALEDVLLLHLDHRQSAALCGDGVELTGGGLLPHTKLVERGVPGLLVDDWR